MVVPADTPVTTPVDGFIVATVVLDELHTIVPVAAVDNVIVEPTHTAVGPVMAGADGNR